MASEERKDDRGRQAMPNLDRLLKETAAGNDHPAEAELEHEWAKTGALLLDRIRFPWFLRQQ